MKRTYLEILKCFELLAGFAQTGVLFVFPYLIFSPWRSLITLTEMQSVSRVNYPGGGGRYLI